MSWVNFKIIETNKREVKNYMTSIKLLFNHNSILYSINLITYDWSSIIQSVLLGEVYFINLSSNYINYNCIFHNQGMGISERTEKLALSGILVFIVMLLVAILACCRGSINAVKDKGINILLFSLWAIYPDLCQ